MAKCPNCGHKKLFLKTMSCLHCGKQCCEKCGIYMFKLWDPQRIILDKWYACSSECLEEFASQVEKEVTPSDSDLLGDLSYAIPILSKRTLLNPKYRRKLSPEAIRQINDFTVNFAPLEELDYIPRKNRLWQRLLSARAKLEEYRESVQVSNWIKAGRFEDAAQFYEKRGMYEEAGRIRAKGREILVKDMNIKVDLNALLKQISEGGIVAVYRCPNCGGKLKIGKETTVASLRTCEHCGSEIQTVDLADFLKTVLS